MNQAAQPKTIVKIKISGTAESHSRTLLSTRDLIDISDEPEVRGGTNEGFAPTEMAMASFIACSNVISHKIAEKNHIPVQDMRFELEAEFNRLGVTLQEDIAVPFEKLDLVIYLTTSATDAQLEVLKQDLPKYCPVGKLFSQAGTKVTTTWVVERP